MVHELSGLQQDMSSERYRVPRWAVLAAIASLLVACSSDERSVDMSTTSSPATTVTLPPTTIPLPPTAAPLPPTTETVAPSTTHLLDTTTTETSAPATTTEEQSGCDFGHNTKADTNRYTTFVQLSNLVGTAINTGEHDEDGECYERVVLRFNGDPDDDNTLPGWHVRYVDPPILRDPSGEAVTVDGNAYLQVTVGSWMYGEQGGNGPTRVTDTALENVQELVLTENNEGQSTWTIGLDQRRNFDVLEVSGTENCPVLCIVIDIGDNLPANP